MVGNADIQAEQGGERAQQAFGLPPRPTKGQAQQVPGVDRDVRVRARPAPPTRLGWVPGRQGLRRYPHRQATALLERPVVLRPVAHPVARPGYPVAAGLIGHWPCKASVIQTMRETDLILPAQASPKPPTAFCAPRPHQRVISVPDKDAFPSQTRFHHALEPFVQHMGQEDVRKAGRDYTPLRGALGCAAQETVFNGSCFQPFINHPSDNAVRDSWVEECSEVGVRNRIEILAYVDIEHPVKTLGPQYILQSAERLVSRPPRPEAV